MKTLRQQQCGVTLVEACIVMAVLGIVTTSAAPGMQGFLDTRRLDGAASQLATDIQHVRSLAVARNEPVRLSVYAGTATAPNCWCTRC